MVGCVRVTHAPAGRHDSTGVVPQSQLPPIVAPQDGIAHAIDFSFFPFRCARFPVWLFHPMFETLLMLETRPLGDEQPE